MYNRTCTYQMMANEKAEWEPATANSMCWFTLALGASVSSSRGWKDISDAKPQTKLDTVKEKRVLVEASSEIQQQIKQRKREIIKNQKMTCKTRSTRCIVMAENRAVCWWKKTRKKSNNNREKRGQMKKIFEWKERKTAKRKVVQQKAYHEDSSRE